MTLQQRRAQTRVHTSWVFKNSWAISKLPLFFDESNHVPWRVTLVEACEVIRWCVWKSQSSFRDSASIYQLHWDEYNLGWWWWTRRKANPVWASGSLLIDLAGRRTFKLSANICWDARSAQQTRLASVCPARPSWARSYTGLFASHTSRQTKQNEIVSYRHG